jgi:hypothetical protein
MHAPAILLRCLPSVLSFMHAARLRLLLRAVDALVYGRRLTLIGLARSWPDHERVHAPLKALDRLLSNPHLHEAISPLYQAMTRWLVRGARPLILVDWADLKDDGRWCVLRAAVPVGGRALTVFECIFPISCMGSPRTQQTFLRELRRALPRDIKPILATDAGFRSDWYRGVRKLGWDFIGRLRNNTCVATVEQIDWQQCSNLHGLASSKPRDLGTRCIVKGDPMECRLVLTLRARRGREQYTRKGKPAQGTQAKKSRKSAGEPWLLVTSLKSTELTARQVIGAYAKRMQIEEAFRDLKSHQYGMGLEDSQTRSAPRLAVLLLLNALAIFAAWLMALAGEADDLPDPMTRQRKHRHRYSFIRRGLEWLRRAEVPPNLDWLRPDRFPGRGAFT